MQFERNYRIGVREISTNNRLSNIGLLGFLEEIASEHAATVGDGVNDIPDTKRAWIIMDWKLKIIERPIYGEILHIKTWSRLPIKKICAYTYRDFEVYNGNDLIAIATSKWAMVNSEKGKVIRLTDEIINPYKSESKSVFEKEEIENINALEEYDSKLQYKACRADIDINKHVNNVNYLKIANEILPEDIYENEELDNLQIMYKHQIKLGDNVNCYYKFDGEKHKIIIKSEDNKILHSVVELN